MEQAILNLMENLLTDEDIKHINALENGIKLDDDDDKSYEILNDLKLYCFKKGFKSAIDIMNYCGR